MMNIKNIAIALALAAAPFCADAQNIADEYKKLKAQMMQEYEDFRAQINAEYQEAVRKAWLEVKGCEPVQKFRLNEEKPAKVNHDDDAALKETESVAKKTVNKNNDFTTDEEFHKNRPQPVSEVKQVSSRRLATNARVKKSEETPAKMGKDGFKHLPFTFFGTELSVRLDAKQKLSIGKFSPDNVANSLKALSSEQYDNLIYDCLQIREEYDLSDWAYLQLIKTVAEKFCGGNNNEAVVLEGYVLGQTGYKIRYGFNPGTGRIYLLAAFRSCLQNCGYFTLEDGEDYFLIDKEAPGQLLICQAAYPMEKKLSLFIPSEQKFALAESETRHITSRKYPQLSVDVSVNKNDLDFFSSYPPAFEDNDDNTTWTSYANTPLSANVKKQMYPTLMSVLEGKTNYQKVAMLLNFVQTGFEYKLDDEVWGDDRIFFAEETLYYPNQDCEDRAILFTRLVRDIVGLQCALVHYPGHLSAAVNFGGNEAYGSYYILDEGKFTACDPTYEVAKVGEEMPNMVNTAIAVVVLK